MKKIFLLLNCYFTINLAFNQVTFKVDSVKENKIVTEGTLAVQICKEKFNNPIFIYPNEYKNKTLLGTVNNGFVSTLNYAYANHYPLSFSPDDIWLLILQGICVHNEVSGGAVFSLSNDTSKKRQISIRNDALADGNAEIWSENIMSFRDSVLFYSNHKLDQLTNLKFSTTTQANLICQNVAFLETVKNSFTFVDYSGCGIPKITLQGNREDWVKLLEKVNNLKITGLEEWLTELKWPLQEFINVYDQKVNLRFWKSTYKELRYYQNFQVNGWFIKFFPYTQREVYEFTSYAELSSNPMVKSTKEYSKNSYLKGYDYQFCTHSADNFPIGINEVTINYNNLLIHKQIPEGNHQLQIYSGFAGIEVNEENNWVAPFQGWGIGYKDSFRIKMSRKNDDFGYSLKPSDTSHRDKTQYELDPSGSIVFDKPKLLNIVNSNHELSIKYLKESIKSNAQFVVDSFVTIKFSVSHLGEVGQIEIIGGTKSTQLMITEILMQTSGKWSSPLEYVGYNETSTYQEKLKLSRRANFQIEFTIQK